MITFIMAREISVRRVIGDKKTEELDIIGPGGQRILGHFTNMTGVGSQVLVVCDAVGGFGTVHYQAPVGERVIDVSMHLTARDPEFTYQPLGEDSPIQVSLV